MRPVAKYVANAAGRLDCHLALISAAFERSARPARELLGADGINVLFIDAPDAQLFEKEVLGTAPMYSQAAITEAEVAQAELELHQQPFSQAKWFFGAEGVTRMFGYAYGYRICRDYARSTAKRAPELVNVPAPAVLRADGLGQAGPPGLT